jgi:hypothetical protein
MTDRGLRAAENPHVGIIPLRQASLPKWGVSDD